MDLTLSGQSRGVTDGTSSVATFRLEVPCGLGWKCGRSRLYGRFFDGRLLLSASYTANWSKYAATSFGLIYQSLSSVPLFLLL